MLDPRLTTGLRIVYALLGAILLTIGVVLMVEDPSGWVRMLGAVLLTVAGAGAIGGAVLGYMPGWLAALVEGVMLIR